MTFDARWTLRRFHWQGVTQRVERLRWIALVLALWGTPLPAQLLQFRHLGVDDGLPSSLVSAIVQDRQGFLWIGTSNGVARFDGLRFRAYDARRDSADALPRGQVDQLYEDRGGRLWVVTSAGASVYDPTRDGFRTYAVDAITGATRPAGASGAGRPRPVATRVLDDRAGGVWVGTSEGLYRLNPATGAARVVPLPAVGAPGPAPFVSALFEDRAGRLWVGTKHGLFELGPDGSQRRWTRLGGPEGNLPDDFVRSLAEDGSGRLWVGTANGIATIDATRSRVSPVRHQRDAASGAGPDRIASLLLDRNGSGLWVGTESDGVDFIGFRDSSTTHHRFDPDDPSSLSGNSVWALHQDRSGLIWVGTFSGGLNVSTVNGMAIRHFRSSSGDPSSLSYNAVPAFAEDRTGQLWVGTDGGGLNRWDRTGGRFERFTTQTSDINVNAVLSIAADRRGALWVATWAGGISRFDPASRHFTSYTTASSDIPHDNVYEVRVDYRDSVWVGTDNGMLAMLDRRSGRFPRRYSLVAPGHDPSSVLMLRELADHRFAAALRDGGLTLLDPVTGRTTYYGAAASSQPRLASDAIRGFVERDSGILWIGTDDGVDILELGPGRVRHVGVADGLPSDDIRAMETDAGGTVWISTDRGVAAFDPGTGAARIYTKSDGLQGNEFLMRAAFRSRDGTLFFGGNNGFNTIRPDRLIEGRTAPPIVFTELMLFNKAVRPGAEHAPLRRVIGATDTVTLSHRQNVIGIEFAALEYGAPERTQYAYRLDGFDPEWQHVGAKRSASYTNLEPGRYTFRVRATNAENAQSGSMASLELIILPPWWRTWWFALLATTVVGLSLVWLWRFQQQRRVEIALSNQALHDPLTGLANRLLFQERLGHALARIERVRRDVEVPGLPPDRAPCLAVLFLDLDNFKTVNDTLGHHAGDVLLKVVASRLIDSTRRIDTVARFGGDEFAVLLEEMSGAHDAHIVADRITEALSRPIAVGDAAQPHDAQVGVSVGIAFAYMDSLPKADELMRHADAAMYRAKSDGKGRRAVFEPSMAHAVDDALDLRRGITRAAAQHELSLRFQPIINLETGRVTAVEALLRWTHPTLGPILPSDFIPLAEATGAMLDIGEWVLREACRAAAAWPIDADDLGLPVTVNISSRQLLHPALLPHVASALALSGLAPARLTLEIGEHALMADVDATLSVLQQLKALGVGLAIDDFGTGYSSLRYLHRFPVDELKIDRSFIDSLGHSPQEASLTAVLIVLGESLGLRMVAEGVETATQHATLIQLGCTHGQGYQFSPPLVEHDVHALLLSGGMLPIGEASSAT